MGNCEVLRVSIENSDRGDLFILERVSVKAGNSTIGEVEKIDVIEILNAEGRFVLPYDYCNYFEVKLKLVPLTNH